MSLSLFRLLKRQPQIISKRLSRKGLYSFLTVNLSKLPSEAKVLQVGSAGPVPDLAKKIFGSRLITLDINSSKNPDIVCDLCDMHAHFPDNSLDAVILSEVLEHIAMPQKAIDEIFRVLKTGGMLIGSTPFLFPLHAVPHDYYRFTIYGLKHLLRNFQKVEIQARNSYGDAISVQIIRMCQANNPRYTIRGFINLILGLLLYPILKLTIPSSTGTQLGPTGYVWLGYK